MRRELFALLVVFVVGIGCSGQRPAPTKTRRPLPTLHPTAQIQAAEVTVDWQKPENRSTSVLFSQLTPTSSPTSTNTSTPTQTPYPTQTPSPTQTPTPSPTPCSTPGKIVTGSYASVLTGMSNYRIYLPPCYGVDGRFYPTLYILPGNVYTDATWDDLGLDEAAEAAIVAGEIPSLLIVMADGGWIANNTSGGPGSYERLILDDLIPFIELNYCSWPEGNGRAIGGLSRGGYWALEIAFRHPESFRSVGGHSAALLDIYAGPTLNPQYTGINNELGDLRIYLDIGEDDWVIANPRKLHEDMEANGVEHTWIVNAGVHNTAYWAAHLNEYLIWYTAPWTLPLNPFPLCEK